MQISQEPIDALRAQVSVTLDKNDYKDRCDKILKAQRKQITLPGFRKGKVPMSIVQKQYGRAVLAEEINKLLSESLAKHIQEKTSTRGHFHQQRSPFFDMCKNTTLNPFLTKVAPMSS